jgi:hypothetical protein
LPRFSSQLLAPALDPHDAPHMPVARPKQAEFLGCRSYSTTRLCRRLILLVERSDERGETRIVRRDR